MPEDAQDGSVERRSSDDVIWNLASLDQKMITEEEVACFRAHPDQIDEVSPPLGRRRLFLWLDLIAGVVLVVLSKTLEHSGAFAFAHPGVAAFAIDVVFEVGVALIGAAIVTFMIGITLNQRQASAKRWRKEVRRCIAQAA